MRGLSVQELEGVAGGTGAPEVPTRPSGISQLEWDLFVRQLEEQNRRHRQER